MPSSSKKHACFILHRFVIIVLDEPRAYIAQQKKTKYIYVRNIIIIILSFIIAAAVSLW